MGKDAAPKSRQKAAVGKGHQASKGKNVLKHQCVTVEEYIAVVERIEANYQKKRGKPVNPFQLISALRKIWNGAEYDCDVSGTAQWGARLWYSYVRLWTSKTKFYSPFDTILYDARNTGRLDRKLTTFQPRDWNILVGVKCLRSKQHGCIDFGHTLCGLDACVNCTKAHQMHSGANELSTKQRLEAAITWAGDVGSVYGETHEYTETKPFMITPGQVEHIPQKVPRASDAKFNEVWEDRAHWDDLLADVDGIVLGTRLRKKRAGQRPTFHSLAAELKNYYVDSPWSQSSIFKTFNSIYGNKALDDTFIKQHVKAFVDALTAGTPTFDDVALSRCVKKWQKFVANHIKGANTKHACKDGKEKRFAYNKRWKGRDSQELAKSRPKFS